MHLVNVMAHTAEDKHVADASQQNLSMKTYSCHVFWILNQSVHRISCIVCSLT